MYFKINIIGVTFDDMIFLTGATGYLGSYLLLDLLENGYEVRALKRHNSSMKQVDRVFNAYVKDIEALPGKVEWVDGDMLDIFSLTDLMPGTDTVIHCAGMVSFYRKDRQKLQLLNVEGTANMVNASLETGIRRFIYVSSIAAMGFGSDDQVISEKTVWKNSRLNSKYAISKYNGEKEVWRGKEEGLDVLVINPSIILGYGDVNHGTFRFLDTINRGLRFYPCGMNGFIYVKDVSRATTQLLQSDLRDEKFVLSGENLTYLEFLNIIARLLHKKDPTIKIGRFMASVSWRVEAARSWLTGSKPLVTKETALTSTQWYQYEGKKIEGVNGFQYTSIEESLQEILEQFRKVGFF